MLRAKSVGIGQRVGFAKPICIWQFIEFVKLQQFIQQFIVQFVKLIEFIQLIQLVLWFIQLVVQLIIQFQQFRFTV